MSFHPNGVGFSLLILDGTWRNKDPGGTSLTRIGRLGKKWLQMLQLLLLMLLPLELPGLECVKRETRSRSLRESGLNVGWQIFAKGRQRSTQSHRWTQLRSSGLLLQPESLLLAKNLLQNVDVLLTWCRRRHKRGLLRSRLRRPGLLDKQRRLKLRPQLCSWCTAPDHEQTWTRKTSCRSRDRRFRRRRRWSRTRLRRRDGIQNLRDNESDL